MKKNKLGNYFIKELLKNYIYILSAFSLIIWVTQAVRLLDLIGEEGNSIATYFSYVALIFPKFFSRLSIIIFFICLIVTIIRFEEQNELRAIWLSGLEKKKFIFFLIKSSFFLVIILIIIKLFIIPYFSYKSRSILLDSESGSISQLLRENNFNYPLKGLTVYVGKKNQINELDDIILFENSAEYKKTIIAKSGIIINEKNKTLLVLLDGSVQEEKGGKISILDFDKTTLDLNQYSKKTVTYFKFNETLFFDLLKQLKIPNNPQKVDIVSEINDRLAMPLFLPSLILIASFLIIIKKETINYTFLKIIIFITGITVIILSEILLDISSKKNFMNNFFYFFPLVLFISIGIIVNFFIDKKNK